jgi:Fibronectin type III domain
MVKRVRQSGIGAVVGTVCAAVLLVAFASAANAQAAVPGKPTNVSATAGNQQVEVHWTAPAAAGGSPITGYTVTPYRGETKQPAITLETPDTSTTVKGLHNNAAYTFKVAAINAAGAGALSDASNRVTPKGPGKNAWYQQKRWWAAGLVVLVALIVIGVFAFRPKKPGRSATDAEAPASTT